MNRPLVPVLGLALFAIGAAVAGPRLLPHASAPPDAAELGLHGAHASAWMQLREASMQLRDDRRARLRERLDRLDVLLDADAPDLRGFAHDTQAQVDALRARARALHERELDLYAQLDPGEQAQVRAVLKTRLDRLRRWRERLGDAAAGSP